MILIPLQSGSAGNCLYVESGNVRLLFDAGISGIQVRERLAVHHIDPSTINGLFITHEHADHIKCAGVLGRKFNIPLHITEPTYLRSKRRYALETIPHLQHFKSGHSIKIGHITIESVPTPHDAVDGVVFVIDDGKKRLGICTDFGHVYSDIRSLVNSVDALFLESNYDELMLKNGNYPQVLKNRISGAGGHISNLDSAELIAEAASSRLQWVYSGHLSQENNLPQLVTATHRKVLGERLTLHIAQRYLASQRVEVLPASQRISGALHSSSQPSNIPYNLLAAVASKRWQPELFPGYAD